MLVFDDFAVGQAFPLGPRVISAADIISFAGEFDPQPFHLDEAAARDSVLGGLSASGFHSGSMVLELVWTSLLSRCRFHGLSQIAELNWLKPVYAGDRLSGAVEVTALDPQPPGTATGLVSLAAQLDDQNGQRKLALSFVVEVGKRRP
jgi:acyl dehydratase